MRIVFMYIGKMYASYTTEITCHIRLSLPLSWKLIQILWLIHMFVFDVVNSYRKIFQKLLLGCNWGSFQHLPLVIIWLRLVFILD